MYRILKLVLLVVAANCAPTTFVPIPAPLTPHYFYYAPQPQAQLQYQPLLKLQQPTATVNRIDAPKEQYVLFYPSVPQLPIMALRQDEISNPDFWTSVTNWFGGFTTGQNPAPGEPPAEGGGSTTDTKTENIMMEKNAEPIQPLMPQPLMPASIMPLNKRLFIVSGQPQFYGNFAALQPAAISNPTISIQPRSPIASIPAENEKVELPPVVAEVFQQPTILQPGAALQLRGNIVEPLQRLEIEQPKVPLVNNEPVPEVAAQELARFLEEARSQDTTANTENALNEKEMKSEKLEAEENPLEEEPSIAQAKPSGIALSGKGGLSSSAPVATAVVGEGGLALASPSAIALSGDFTDEEQEERKMAAMD